MTEPRWARVRTDARCSLRRGAWYPILELTPLKAILPVNARPLGVPLALLHLAPDHPGVWSVVPRPPHARALPVSWGPRYAVCPVCSDRARLGDAVASLRCPGCGGVFLVGWGDAYFA